MVLRKIGFLAMECNFLLPFVVLYHIIILLHIRLELFDSFGIMLANWAKAKSNGGVLPIPGANQYHIEGRITYPATTNTDIDSITDGC